MRMNAKTLQILSVLLCSFPAYAVQTNPNVSSQPVYNAPFPDPIEEKSVKEDFIPLKYIGIAFYKPNYVLPLYYTASPANSVYQGNTPYGESLKKTEVKYQFSFKVPLWKNINCSNSSLYFGYTLLSYWQAYSNRPFVRSNDYEPDFFLANKLNYYLYGDWKINFLNAGYSHESNGQGDNLQRGWDRVYLDAITTVNDWLIDFRPWYIVHKNSKNSDIGSYLGYAKLIIGYKFFDNVIAFELTNLFAQPKRTSANLTWSFPITPYLKGYVQGFTGYGQSLIEYNHRTNAAGIGFAFSDWM